MTRALWRKAIGEARVLLAATTLVLFGFCWLYVWLSSFIKLDALKEVLDFLPVPVQRLPGIPFSDVTTSVGLIAMMYIDPVILVTIALWAVSRGSDVVSGEIDRGTMEILLAQPIPRWAIMVTQSVVTIVGCAILAGAVFAGTSVGILLNGLSSEVPIADFLPAALNLFFLAVAQCGMVTLLSTFDRYRARTVGIAGGIVVLHFIFKIVARMWPNGEWFVYLTLFGAYEPQVMVTHPERAWPLLGDYGLALGLVSLLAFVGAGVVFQRRDIPAPL